MAICNVCKEKIMYNKYKRYRKKILCLKCYATRLDRKAAKKVEVKVRAKAIKIVTPSKKAKKAAKKQGMTTCSTLDISSMGDMDESKETEDSN